MVSLTPTATFSQSGYNALPVGDAVNFNDQGDNSTGLTYGLDATTVTRTGWPQAVTYQNMESVTLNAGLQSATINVAALKAARAR